jgi:hypothetical protein
MWFLPYWFYSLKNTEAEELGRIYDLAFGQLRSQCQYFRFYHISVKMASDIPMHALAPESTDTGTKDPIKHLVTGYPKLAGHMELRPEAAIFRRFGALNFRNLLYMQAELTSLDIQLCEREREDNRQTGYKPRYALDWFWLNQSKSEDDSAQIDLVLKIRKRLKEYNEALIQQSMIQNLPEPHKYDMKFIQTFLHNTSETGRLALVGDDAKTWGTVANPKSYSPDLVAVRPRPKEDAFSSWVANNAVVYLFRCGCARFKKPHRVHQVVGLDDNTILQVTYWITSIFASLILVASISMLYFVRSMPARLGIIGVFNIVMSICLKPFTNAKRSEVFAITCAFAAVQVVFVGTESHSDRRG